MSTEEEDVRCFLSDVDVEGVRDLVRLMRDRERELDSLPSDLLDSIELVRLKVFELEPEEEEASPRVRIFFVDFPHDDPRRLARLPFPSSSSSSSYIWLGSSSSSSANADSSCLSMP